MFDHGFLIGSSLADFRKALNYAAQQSALQGQPPTCSTRFTAVRPTIFHERLRCNVLTLSGVPAEPGDDGSGADNRQGMSSSMGAADEALLEEAAFVEEAEQW